MTLTPEVVFPYPSLISYPTSLTRFLARGMPRGLQALLVLELGCDWRIVQALQVNWPPLLWEGAAYVA